jgi:hypothetical protein
LGRSSHAVMAEPHMAGWQGLANLAGPTRNREMVEAGADRCIAMHRSIGTTEGTMDCVRQTLAAGIPKKQHFAVRGGVGQPNSAVRE